MKTKQQKPSEEITSMRDGISLTAVAERFGISMRTLDRWRKDGLWSVRCGRFRYTTEEKLAEFMHIKNQQSA